MHMLVLELSLGRASKPHQHHSQQGSDPQLSRMPQRSTLLSYRSLLLQQLRSTRLIQASCMKAGFTVRYAWAYTPQTQATSMQLNASAHSQSQFNASKLGLKHALSCFSSADEQYARSVPAHMLTPHANSLHAHLSIICGRCIRDVHIRQTP